MKKNETATLSPLNVIYFFYLLLPFVETSLIIFIPNSQSKPWHKVNKVWLSLIIVPAINLSCNTLFGHSLLSSNVYSRRLLLQHLINITRATSLQFVTIRRCFFSLYVDVDSDVNLSSTYLLGVCVLP